MFSDAGIKAQIAKSLFVILTRYSGTIHGLVFDHYGFRGGPGQNHTEFHFGVAFICGNADHFGQVIQWLHHHGGGIGVGVIIDVHPKQTKRQFGWFGDVGGQNGGSRFLRIENGGGWAFDLRPAGQFHRSAGNAFHHTVEGYQ